MIPGTLAVSLEEACFWLSYDPQRHIVSGVSLALSRRGRRLVVVLERLGARRQGRARRRDGRGLQGHIEVFYRVLAQGTVCYVRERALVSGVIA